MSLLKQGHVQPRQNGANRFFKRKRWCVEHCSDDASVATMAAEKDILCVLFEEFSELTEICINTCLILQNTLDVTVTALALQNKREHPNRVKGFVETVVPNIVIQHVPRISGWKDKHFSWRIIHFLPLRLWYDLYDRIIFIVSIRLIIADHWLLCYDIVIFAIINQRSIEKCMNVSLHNTIAKYINMCSIFMLH